MFDNISGKLKGLAYFTAIGGAIVFGIIALVYLFISLISSVLYFVTAITCIVASWATYGIGELIEYAQSTDSKMERILAEQAAPPQLVSIEKSETKGTEAANNKRFFVKNYYPGLYFQAVELQLISKENRDVFFAIDLYSYKDFVITAVNIDLEFKNVFNDKWIFKDIPCTNICHDGSSLRINEQFIQLDPYRMQSIKSIYVRINKYIYNNNIVVNMIKDKEITLSECELSDLKYVSGINAVTPFKKTEESWTCVCGTDNDQEKTECKLCGKSIRIIKNSDRSALDGLFDKLELLNSACEMQDYLVEYNKKYNSEKLSNFIFSFQDTVQFEKMYGNQKKDALKLIKKELTMKSDAVSLH